jgi:hypothetical protein
MSLWIAAAACVGQSRALVVSTFRGCRRDTALSHHVLCHVAPTFQPDTYILHLLLLLLLLLLLGMPLPLATPGTQLRDAHHKQGIRRADVAIFISPEFSVDYYRSFIAAARPRFVIIYVHEPTSSVK